MVEVTLTWEELHQSAIVGCNRKIRALRKDFDHRYGYDPSSAAEDWGTNILGAIAEMAVAKHLNIFWADRPELDYKGDVGRYQVRTTWRPNGSLLLHDDDKDGQVFILACGCPPTWRLAGWLLAVDGKQPRYWQTRTGRPCYMVPQTDLHDMFVLPPA